MKDIMELFKVYEPERFKLIDEVNRLEGYAILQ